ncbi:MAG: DNA alkylation repair protein [Terriglobia bacterium]|nr:MAG: DNA alkylation repair protein [Terriglobia bacterium]
MALVRALRRALATLADPAKAPAMQAYMKSEMPYLGVQAPQLRQAAKSVFAEHPLATFETWRDTVLELWRSARYREERYAAIELAGNPRYRGFRTLEALPLYEEIIITGAWWDYVDTIATHLLGELLRHDLDAMGPLLRQWALSENIWKRRAAILAQLSFKRDTDQKLLYDCIAPSIDASEFFLRKAIGWALREYAKTEPAEVIRFVRRHEARLSALTKREALRRLATI